MVTSALHLITCSSCMLHLIRRCFTAVVQTARVVYVLLSSLMYNLHRTLQFPPQIKHSAPQPEHPDGTEPKHMNTFCAQT